MQTMFTHTIRALLCERCGAPIQGTLAGGAVQCQYCQSQNQLRPRDDNPLGQMVPQQPISEQERFSRLAQQDGQPMVPPPEVQALMQGGGIADWKVQEAVQVWQGSRQELRNTGSPQAGERMLFLTMLLGNYFHEKRDQHHERALYESSLDVAQLPRHKQMIRGFLCRAAVRAGDLEAAEQWLAPCDQRSDDLQMDTAWRYSRAFIETARGNFQGVLQVLGQGLKDVPLMDAMETVCIVLRANAWERLGRVDVAADQLRQLMLSGGGQGRRLVETVQQRYAEWQLCPQSYPAAQQAYAGTAAKQASGAQGGMVGMIFMAAGGFCILLAVILGGIGIFSMVTSSASSGMPGASMAGTGMGMGWLMGAGITGVTGLPFFFIGFRLRKSGQKAARIRIHGLAATGTVVSARPTGMEINNVPQMLITLQIQIAGRAPYQASTKLLVNYASLAALQPGAQLPVRVDPENPQEIVIETG